MLGMGRIEAATLAYERSILATDSAASRQHFNVCDSITNWCLTLVRGQDPARLPPASEALAGTYGTYWRVAAGVRQVTAVVNHPASSAGNNRMALIHIDLVWKSRLVSCARVVFVPFAS